MLGLLPSVYGLAAAAAFFILFLLAVDAEQWPEAAAYGLLAFAYALRHIPKLIVLGFLNLLAHLAFLAGAALFIFNVADGTDLF
jgi:hypothetical protein